MSLIAVIDYEMGNLHSVCKGLQNAGAKTKITDDPELMAKADGLVLPGVGSFDPAVQHLRSRHLEKPIKQAIATGKPFLGICLGLQVLFESSEEGKESGLGVLAGTVRRFRSEPGLSIPQMGWNQLHLIQPDIPLWQNVAENSWVYFVHSYYVDPTDPVVRAATVTHGQQTVTAAIAQNNLFAVQFHPEKSSTLGLQILSNFVNLVQSKSPKR